MHLHLMSLSTMWLGFYDFAVMCAEFCMCGSRGVGDAAAGSFADSLL